MKQASVIYFGHFREDGFTSRLPIVLMESVCEDKREEVSVEKVV